MGNGCGLPAIQYKQSFRYTELAAELRCIFTHNRKMMTLPDYTGKTLEELKAEEKKLKNMRTMSALFIGVMIGIMIFSLATRGFKFLAILLPVLLIAYNARNMKAQQETLNAIRAEISKRNMQA